MKNALSTGIAIVLIVAAVGAVLYYRDGRDQIPPPPDGAATITDPGANPGGTATTTDNLSTMIQVSAPANNATITSPVTITGKARGNWYFEASFPIRIVDANGKTNGQAPAQAQGEWMTTEFVPFMVSIPFTKPATATGKIILEKDNPSGLPENAAQIEIPVKFGTEQSRAQDGCSIGGCSGQICSEQKDIASTCEWREAYACYQTATCKKQANGKCGWTETTALKQCLSAAE